MDMEGITFQSNANFIGSWLYSSISDVSLPVKSKHKYKITISYFAIVINLNSYSDHLMRFETGYLKIFVKPPKN